MYSCGLTVYARGHIGNFRTFVSLDVLRRALRYQEGYDVRQVTNYTDVDDKTINAAQQAGVPLRDYTDRYIAAFQEDAAAMGLEPAEENPRATDEANMRAMVDDDPAARGARPHLRVGRVGLLPDRVAAGLRQARAARSRWHAGRRARRLRLVRQAGRPRLRAVEGHASRASRRGTSGSGPAGRAGTSSARPWRCACWASRRSTSTAAAST